MCVYYFSIKAKLCVCVCVCVRTCVLECWYFNRLDVFNSHSVNLLHYGLWLLHMSNLISVTSMASSLIFPFPQQCCCLILHLVFFSYHNNRIYLVNFVINIVEGMCKTTEYSILMCLLVTTNRLANTGVIRFLSAMK